MEKATVEVVLAEIYNKDRKEFIMKRYLIATHGEMASGIASTIQLLVGERDDITYIDAYVKDDFIAEEVKQFFNTYAEDDILVFTDLLAGSVNRELMLYVGERVHIIAGFNLPLLLECLLSDVEWTKEWIAESIKMACSQIVYVNQLMKGE